MTAVYHGLHICHQASIIHTTVPSGGKLELILSEYTDPQLSHGQGPTKLQHLKHESGPFFFSFLDPIFSSLSISPIDSDQNLINWFITALLTLFVCLGLLVWFFFFLGFIFFSSTRKCKFFNTFIAPWNDFLTTLVKKIKISWCQAVVISTLLVRFFFSLLGNCSCVMHMCCCVWVLTDEKWNLWATSSLRKELLFFEVEFFLSHRLIQPTFLCLPRDRISNI